MSEELKDDLIDVEEESQFDSEAFEEALDVLKKALTTMSQEDRAKLLLDKVLNNLIITLEEGMATAADYGVAIRFLKDNSIGITPTRDNVAGKLQDKLAESSRRASEDNVVPVQELGKFDIDDFVEGLH